MDVCPRCGSGIPPEEGTSSSPLCDPCWASAGDYGNGYWTGKAGWAPEQVAFETARYSHGYRRGKAAREVTA